MVKISEYLFAAFLSVFVTYGTITTLFVGLGVAIGGSPSCGIAFGFIPYCEVSYSSSHSSMYEAQWKSSYEVVRKRCYVNGEKVACPEAHEFIRNGSAVPDWKKNKSDSEG